MKIFSLLIVIALLVGCNNEKRESHKAENPRSGSAAKKPESPEPVATLSQQDSIMAAGREVLISLKQQNFPELVKYFSSDGVLFSPYGHIDPSSSKKLVAADFLLAVQKNWVLTWGSYDGTGEPIKLQVKEYLRKFVYDADFLESEAVAYDEVIKSGNTQSNIKTLYPKAHFIDYHFSGFDQRYKGMDWTSLKLVFDKVDDQYFLLAVIHDQWTI